MGKYAYPVTRRDEDAVEDFHGTVVPDPYRWLEDPNSAETEEWVRQQNQVTEKVFEEIPSRDRIEKRLNEVYDYPKFSCPFKRGSHYFFHKNDGLQNQAVMYIQDSLDSEPSVFLDPNTLSEDGTAALKITSFSECAKYFAYSVSYSGSDWETVFVRDVSSRKDTGDRLEWVKFSSVSWTHDSKGFYYSRFPALEQANADQGKEVDQSSNHRLYYHVLGTAQSEDQCVFALPDDPKMMLHGEVSDDGKTLLISISESCDPKNKLYVVPIGQGDPPRDANGWYLPVKLIDTFEAQYNYITNEGTDFFFQTNLDAPRDKVIAFDLSNPAKENWREILPQSDDVLQIVVCCNHKYLVVVYMHHVREILQIYDLTGKKIKDLDLPDIGAVGSLSGRKEQSELFYSFTSYLYPGSIFYYNFDTDSVSTFRETVVPGFDASQFVTNQVFYPSKDGTKIPMFLVHRRNLELNSDNMTMLYGYGGFNISMSPAFSPFRVVFLQHFDGMLALPNLRGGGEYGIDWYKAGRLDNKQNVFDDFHAAAEYLIREKYTKPSRIGIMGGSNGGLLVGACANQRPELYGVAVSQVGVLDMLKFDRFTIGHFWVSDYGSAKNAHDFEVLYKYSPLHNVRAGGGYPAMLLLTGDHDDRVVPLHSYKHIAQLQHVLGHDEAQTKPLLISVDVKAGHGAGKPTTKRIKEAADIYAFMAHYLGSVWHE